MANKPSPFLNSLLWGQLIFFIIAVSFVAGGGQNTDLLTSYNHFIYFKAAFLSLPILISIGWCCVSFLKFWNGFKTVLIRHTPLLFYFTFAALSLVFAYDLRFSAMRLTYTGGAVFSLWCLMAQYIMITKGQPRTLICQHLLLSFAVMILTVPILAGIISGVGALLNLRDAIQSTGLMHPNTMASFCAYGFFHALFYPQSNSVWQKVLTNFILVITPIFILLIFSRSVIGAMILALIISGWFSFLWFRSYRALAAIGGVFFMTIMSALLIHLHVIQGEWIIGSIARTENGMDIWTLTHRTELWQRLLETLNLKIFMLGNGYGVMTEGFGINFGTGIIYGAHNIYLSILLGTGIFSLIAFLSYLGSIFLNLRKTHGILGKPLSLQGVAVLSFFMIHSMTSTEFSLNLSVSFTVLMLMAALMFVDESDKK